MRQHDYWGDLLRYRISRRQGVRATIAGTAGAALLAACGGSDSPSSSGAGEEASSGLVAKVVDETKSVKRGGVFKGRRNFEIVHLDPQVTGNHTSEGPAFYSALFRITDGHLANTDGTVEGDIIQSWEVSGDKTTITAKIHPKATWHPVAPVNGRAVDAEDVVTAWDRFLKIGTRGQEVANSIDPVAPVVSITATDKQTIAIKLSKPNSLIFTLLGQTNVGTFFIVPKEAAGDQVDLRRNPIGSGPWMLKEWLGDIGIFYKKHPGFGQDKRGDIVYLDEWALPTVSENAAVLAQFRAGQIHQTALQAQDILPLKKELPVLDMYETDISSSYFRTFFGQLDSSPFKDQRVRQAWVLTYDRDLFIDAYYEVSKFLAEGLPVATGWDTALRASDWDGWWLDPKGKDFGPNAKYFRRDMAEAKKLLTAAGHPDGLSSTVHFPGSGYPQAWRRMNEIILGMVGEEGLFKLEQDLVNYSADWTPSYRNIRGQFDSVATILDTGSVDPANNIFSHYNSAGALFQGGDAKLDELTESILSEFDDKKRKAIAHDIQRYDAQTNFFPRVGGAAGFELVWPAVRNWRVYRGGTHRPNAGLWLDQTKPPFTS